MTEADDLELTTYLIGIRLSTNVDPITTRISRDIPALHDQLNLTTEEEGLIFSSADGAVSVMFVRTTAPAWLLLRNMKAPEIGRTALQRGDQIFIVAIQDITRATFAVENINRLQGWLSV